MDIFSCPFKRRRKVLFVVYLLGCVVSFSQSIGGGITDANVPEKIYLQLSSKEFTTDETIWFKAIVTDSRNHLPTELSGLLYVDLIDYRNQIVSHKILKLTGGIGHGFIDLEESFKGQFLIRAYTQWNRNFGDDFMFSEHIVIYELAKQKEENLFEQLHVVQKAGEKIFLSGKIQLAQGAKTNPNKVMVLLDWGGGKDSVWVKRETSDVYSLEHEIQKEWNWISIKIKGKEEANHSKTIVLNENALDLQFFPESGKMINGLKNKIGFKAIGYDGKGRKVQGDVFDSRGKKVASFQSNALGMGAFFLQPEPNVRYHTRVVSENNVHVDTIFPLPVATPQGSILSVEKAEEEIRFRVVSNSQTDSITIKVSCRGEDYYLIEGLLHKGNLLSEIPSADLPDGIVVFTLLDKQKQPIAERLFYNESGKEKLQVELTTDKTTYNRREKTRLDIQVIENGREPSVANMSIKVIKKNQWREDVGGFIQSYFYLESELRGNIENPGRYFDKTNPDRLKEIDALLLTQGWRNYKYPAKRQGNNYFWPETGLTVKGRVAQPSAKTRIENEVDLTLAAFGKETSLYTQKTDSLGNFQFLLEDTFGAPMRILLHATSDGKRRKNNTISIDTFSKPKTKYEFNSFAQEPNQITRSYLEAEMEKKKTEEVLDSVYGVTQLDEVVVEDFRLTPERKELYKKYGTPDIVISGDSLKQKEKKWSYGLYSILLFNYGNEVQIERFPDGFMLAHIAGGPTLLMVDGRLLQRHEYERVPGMPPGIIESVELIKFAKFFKSRYLEVFPETNPLDAPYVGHIISINTKGKIGLQGTDKPKPGTLDTTIEVFSPIKEFYSPKYDKPVPINEQKPDLRSLVHWQPILKTDENGKATESFYNGDIPGEYVIIVEGISEEGQLGYQKITYTVD
ncbi:hypothetical protein [Flagellimonas sp. 2504JD1-5]